MSETAISNRDRQEDEVLILSSIYSYKEFSYISEDIIQCYYNIFSTANNDWLRIENIRENLDFDLFPEYHIKYLPPIRLHLSLPINYPNKEAPNFCITTSWLSPWQLSLVCQKLDDIWLENKGQEVLFFWFEFLRNDLLNFLGINDTLDISFVHMVYCRLTNYFMLSSTFQRDIRAMYSATFFDPLIFFINYDQYRQKSEFESTCHTCTICFDECYGKHCIRFENCSHIYCKKCIHHYIVMNIGENNVNNITCPDIKCNANVTFKEVKEFFPDLFSRYDNLLLIKALSGMKDIVYCPRAACQYPVIKNENGTLAICAKCEYSFCTYCYKVYHGVAPCRMTSIETMDLIEEYQSSNICQKKLLEKKYGRKQIEIIVEKHLTNDYLKKHAKACPNCSTMIVKIGGCNKMTCIHCKAYFCWICGILITTRNAYDHFLSVNTTCYKRLFQ